MTNRVVCLVVVLAVAALGCQTLVEEMPAQPSQASGVSVVVTPVPVPVPGGTPLPNPQPTATPNPQPTATPTPAPTPPPSSAGFHHIWVGFFGINCSANGKPEPRLGERKLPTGCRGYLTATPKNENGAPVPPEVHGPDADWGLAYGHGIVRVEEPSFANAFNADLVGVREGEFKICVTVKTVTGCMKGWVTP